MGGHVRVVEKYGELKVVLEWFAKNFLTLRPLVENMFIFIMQECHDRATS